MRRTLIGLVLLVVACLGMYLGLMGMTVDDAAGDGGVLVTLVTIGASAAIGYFGLRYLMLGIRGGGVRFYERAVEADFHRGIGLIPRRRTIPLLHIRVSGSSRLTYATAVTTTGHAFRLPASLVERSDIWYLGSLGTSPIAPGGRGAKERHGAGELEPYRHPTSEPLPDHGPPYPDVPSGPITVDVVVEPEERPEPPSIAPASAPPKARTPTPTPGPSQVVPAPGPPGASGTEGGAPRTVPEAPEGPPEEPEMEVLMDLPDVVTPPEAARRSIPPPPRYRPPSITVPEPPRHKEMERSEIDRTPEDLGPPETTVPTGPEVLEGQAPLPPPPEPSPPPAPPQDATDEWELEEFAPPDDGKKKLPPSPGSEWEEI